MLGKTHIAVGCAIYFCVAQPTDFKSLFAGVAISIIGSEVSDIDEANSKVRRVFNWLLVGIVLLAAAATFIKNQFELSLTLPTCISTSKNLFTLFLLVLLFGYFSHHRNAMHSILIDLILSGIIAIWIGQYGYYFFVAFLSHVLLDTLNHKSVRLFYPLKIGVKFNICKANGFVNNVLFIIATVYAGNMFYQYIMKFLSL